jgi:hypothetical protein
VKLIAGLLLALVCGSASAASYTLPGLCPGYRLAVVAGDLIVTNGPPRGLNTSDCAKSKWRTLRVIGMCKGEKFDARVGSLGNLYISCVKR